MSTIAEQLREILKAHGRLSADPDALSEGADLYEAGLNSHASVNVMLAVEEHFDVEFPDEMLRPSVFASIEAIAAAVTQLGAGQAAA